MNFIKGFMILTGCLICFSVHAEETEENSSTESAKSTIRYCKPKVEKFNSKAFAAKRVAYKCMRKVKKRPSPASQVNTDDYIDNSEFCVELRQRVDKFIAAMEEHKEKTAPIEGEIGTDPNLIQPTDTQASGDAGVESVESDS